jgi:hypothetical protein
MDEYDEFGNYIGSELAEELNEINVAPSCTSEGDSASNDHKHDRDQITHVGTLQREGNFIGVTLITIVFI